MGFLLDVFAAEVLAVPQPADRFVEASGRVFAQQLQHPHALADAGTGAVFTLQPFAQFAVRRPFGCGLPFRNSCVYMAWTVRFS